MIGGRIVNWCGLKGATHLFDENTMDRCILCGISYIEFQNKKNEHMYSHFCKEINSAIKILRKRFKEKI